GLFVRDRAKQAKPIDPGLTADLQRALVEPVHVEIPEFESPAAPAAPAVPAERQSYLQQMKLRLHQQLVERLDVQSLRATPLNVVRQEVRALIRELCQSEKGLLSSVEQEKLMDDVMDETFGLGPLEALLKDPNITDILVNKHD